MFVRRFLATLGVIVGLAITASAATIQAIVDSVDQTHYSTYLSGPSFLYTHSGETRQHNSTQWGYAQTNISNTFQSFGLATSIETGWSNVVAKKSGAQTPNDIFIVGAHYDSVATPGADDNASGVAGILEAARVLSQYEFASTVVFIAFDGEESGLNGSKQYAEAAKARGDNIIGMLDLDMIAASRSRPTDAYIYGLASQDAIRQDVASTLQTYGGITSTILNNPYGLSDHVPFEDQGYQACLLIEYDPFNNHNIHTLNDYVDNPGYIDFNYATRMVKGSVGWIATMAMPIPEPGTIVLLTNGAFAWILLVVRRGRQG